MRTLLLAGIAVLLLTAAPASAVIGGTPDRDAHPYVGFVYDTASGTLCSGSLISPTLFVTAAHCVTDGRVALVTTHPQAIPGHPSFVPGIAFAHPEYCMGCGNGLPGFDRHDLAVVRLFGPIASPRYAQLPELGASDRLGTKSPLTVVGYGVQGFEPMPGGKVPYSDFTRTQATVSLNPGNHSWRDQFLRISANDAAICFGDSGGPNLVGDVMVAINAYANRNCTGNTYSYRLDTESALSFINSFR